MASFGCVDRQTSMHLGHLGENLHPLGKFVGSGIKPPIGLNRSVFVFKLGMDPNNPVV